MDFNIIECVLLAIVTFIFAIDQFSLTEIVYRPIIACPIIGLILGDVNMGLIIGGTYELMMIGNMPVGGAQPPNAVLGSVVAMIFAVKAHMDTNAALGACMIFATFGQYVVTVMFTIMSGLMAKADKAAAEAYFGKAAGTKELGESMGNLYIAQGQYERAVNSFGDAKTNSAALAQILAKDYNKAKNTLAGVEKPDAYTDYLMAVLGARTNNSSMVTSSLKSAVAKEPALAKKAATDLEFSKFFTNADFMSIIK